jgi:heme/copper-type cytochrome/quinol oxidase subunit 2
MSRLKQFVLIGALLLLPITPAAAQGCSMCKTTAEAAAAEQQRSLNHGILVLAIPSVVIFGGLSVFAVRYRSTETSGQSESDQSEDDGLL